MNHPGKIGNEKNSLFGKFAKWAACTSGKSITFLMAVLLILVWAVTGPLFGFSDTWQLVINTTTTIITFLMVFLIQNTQNRDTSAIQIKLDELIRATQGAHNALMDLEELEEHEINRIRKKYEEIAARARKNLEKGDIDTEIPDIKD